MHKTRLNAAPGEGKASAKIFFVGEAPGKLEDELGRPFVGRAGKFLDSLLKGIGLARKEVFITSIVKCRPPKNRNPRKSEIQSCYPYLEEQLALIQPKTVVLLGNTALKAVLGRQNLSKWHGQTAEKGGFRYFITFHPASGMRFPKIREKMKADFERLKKLI